MFEYPSTPRKVSNALPGKACSKKTKSDEPTNRDKESRIIGIDWNPPTLQQPLGYIESVPIGFAPPAQFPRSEASVSGQPERTHLEFEFGVSLAARLCIPKVEGVPQDALARAFFAEDDIESVYAVDDETGGRNLNVP